MNSTTASKTKKSQITKNPKAEVGSDKGKEEAVTEITKIKATTPKKHATKQFMYRAPAVFVDKGSFTEGMAKTHSMDLWVPGQEGEKPARSYQYSVREHNPHSPAAFERTLMRQSEMVRLVNMANNIKKVIRVLSILVLYPTEGEVESIKSQIVLKDEEGKTHTDRVEVRGYRPRFHGNDEARGRKLYPAYQRAFDVDIIVANDCLYYFNSSTLIRDILDSGCTRASLNGATLFGIHHPIVMEKVGSFYVEHHVVNYQGTDGMVTRKLNGAVALALHRNNRASDDRFIMEGSGEEVKVTYSVSPDSSDGVYVSGRLSSLDYSRQLVTEDGGPISWVVTSHVDHSLPGHNGRGKNLLLVRLNFRSANYLDSSEDDVKGNFLSSYRGVSNIPIVGFISREHIPILASKVVEQGNPVSVQSYMQQAVVLVMNAYREYVPLNPSFFNVVSRVTAHEALRLKFQSVPLPQITPNRDVEDFVSANFVSSGLPPLFAKPLAILAGPSSNRIASVVQISRALGSMVGVITGAVWREKSADEQQEVSMQPLSVVRSLARVVRIIYKKNLRAKGAFDSAIASLRLAQLSNYVHKKLCMFQMFDSVEFFNPGAQWASVMLEACATAFVEESLKRFHPVKSWPTMVAQLMALVEAYSDFYCCGDWHWSGRAQTLAITFVRAFFHGALMVLPFPIAVAMHSMWNMVNLIAMGSEGPLDVVSWVMRITKDNEMYASYGAFEDMMKASSPLSAGSYDPNAPWAEPSEFTLAGQDKSAQGDLEAIPDDMDVFMNGVNLTPELAVKVINSTKESGPAPYHGRVMSMPAELESQLVEQTATPYSCMAMIAQRFPERVQRGYPSLRAEVSTMIAIGCFDLWKFEMATPVEVFQYIVNRPWSKSHKTIRLQQLYEYYVGEQIVAGKVKLTIKSFEALTLANRAIPGFQPGVGPKPRPVFPYESRDVADFVTKVGLYNSIKESPELIWKFRPNLTHHSKAGEREFVAKFHFRPYDSPSDRTEFYNKIIGSCDCDVHFLILGDDFYCLFNEFELAMAADVVQCDVNSGPDLQRGAAEVIAHLGNFDESQAKELIEKFLTPHVATMKPTVLTDELGNEVGVEGLSYKKDLRPQVITLTGEPFTSFKAMFGWAPTLHATCQRWVNWTGGHPIDQRPTPQSLLIGMEEEQQASYLKESGWQAFANILEECADMNGLVLEFEQYLGSRVMPASAATFLSGTFALNEDPLDGQHQPYVWTPLKALKAARFPLYVFKGSLDEQARAWCFIQSVEETAIIGPMGHLFSNASLLKLPGMDEVVKRGEVIEQYLSHLQLTNDYRQEYSQLTMSAPLYAISGVGWSTQLKTRLKCVVMPSETKQRLEREADELVAEISNLIQSHGSRRKVKLPFELNTPLDVLFVARFGKLPMSRPGFE